jgi:hypothetical protein
MISLYWQPASSLLLNRYIAAQQASITVYNRMKILSHCQSASPLRNADISPLPVSTTACEMEILPHCQPASLFRMKLLAHLAVSITQLKYRNHPSASQHHCLRNVCRYYQHKQRVHPTISESFEGH